jgi:hypothetical protein
MNTTRIKLKILGLVLLSIAFSLAGCAAGQAPMPQANTLEITGVLTKRGAQIESFWGVRDTSREGGKLWQLETQSASIAEQLTRFRQKTVRVTGEAATETSNATSPFPVLRVLKIELVTQ